MESLGQKIYAHEHTTIDLSGVKKTEDCHLDSFEEVVEEFSKLRNLNITHIVDQTNRGMGRNPQYVQKVQEATGIQILQATGFYKEPFLPPECYQKTERELANLFVQEILNGFENSPIKASFIGEIGTSDSRIEPMEEKIFKAASIAHMETGVPICTHTTLGTMGIEQLDLFSKYGVDLEKVVISHIDLSGDIEYMLRILDQGANIAFDTVGKVNYQLDEDRALWLKELCDRGYSSQIVLSVDITRKSHYKKNGGIGYDYLITNFLPKLEEEQIKSADLNNMLYNTASRVYL